MEFWWSPATGIHNDSSLTTYATPDTTTTYYLHESCPTCNVSCLQDLTDSVTIYVAPPIINTAGADIIIFTGNSVILGSPAQAGVTYQWQPATGLNNPNIAQPLASPVTTTTYTVTATNSGGCAGTDTVTVFVDAECGEIFIPNAFSPNKDGQNELECVYGKCIKSLEFIIYDRWGEKVFETTNPKECWDGTYKGKPLNTSVFVYYMKATLINGKEITKQGNISLIN
jgi:gliding motility-associated-like protein